MAGPIVRMLLLASVATASITCLKVGETATANWTTKAGETCTWTGTVGSNFGTNPLNGDPYVPFSPD